MVVMRVAAAKGSTPNRARSKRGAHSVVVKNSRTLTLRKNSMVGMKRATTIPTVVATETRAHRPSRPAMTRSPWRGFDAPSRRWPSAGWMGSTVSVMAEKRGSGLAPGRLELLELAVQLGLLLGG